jgi:tetratricopeptide (TPR) repeat protein
MLLAIPLFLCGLGSTIQAADEDEALRRKALALNQVTGDKPIKGEIKKLLGDTAGTRKLLRVAVSMAKDKEQPFNYNGAYILATVAFDLRDVNASKIFFRICAEQASKLQSGQKLVEAYEGMMAIVATLYAEKKYEESLKLSQEFLEILDRQGLSPEVKSTVLRQMCKALAKQGKVKEANRLVDNLLQARDSDWRNLEVKAWLQNETGHPDEAIKTYEKVVDRIAKDEMLEKEEKSNFQTLIRERIIDLLVKMGKMDEAGRVVEDILSDRKDDFAKLRLKALLQEKIRQYAAAIKTYEELVERIPKDDSLKLKDEDKAKLQDGIRERIIQLLVKLGKVDEASRVMEDILKGKKDDVSTLEMKGLLQQRIGDFSGAAKTYQDALQRIAKDDSLDKEKKASAQKKIRYVLSNVYVELSRIDKATQELKTLLAEEPDSPSYNNDLGYIWADHDQNLDEAEKMIRKALEEDRKQRKANPDLDSEGGDKDRAAYLDSLGWVLFKQKKFQEAKKYLLEAIQDDEGEFIEIYDHLAEVHMALGEKDKAIEVWKKAVNLETTSGREEKRKAEVEKKLRANQ